ERATSCAELLHKLQRPSVTVAVRVDGRLEDDSAADDLDDRDRMRVAVWVNTDDVVQLICKHPFTDLQPKSWGTRTGVGLGMETAGGRTVTGHALTRGQASDQASKRSEEHTSELQSRGH